MACVQRAHVGGFLVFSSYLCPTGCASGRRDDSFGNGPNRCAGEHLARMDVAIFIEEWLNRIPEFRMDPARPAVTHAGPVIRMRSCGCGGIEGGMAAPY
jgi:hypothetical protein